MANTKYPSLNGLRAISVILVVFSHTKDNLFELPFFQTVDKYIPLLTDGQFGVNVFFLISGFLITSLLIKERTLNGKISLKNFYIRRILRIFPAYYFLLSVYFILELLNVISLSSASWLTSLTYTKYFNWNLDSFTGHFWSLSIEEHFYFMWPLLFSSNRKVRNAFLIGIVLICPIFRIYGSIHYISWLDSLTIFQRLDSITIGCIVAIKHDKIMDLLNKYKILIYLAIIWIFSFSFILSLSRTYHLHIGWVVVPFGGSFGTITNVAIAVIMLFSINNTRGIWFKFLNLKIMEQIGILSYSIYLWQQIFTSDLSFGKNIFPFNLLLIIIASMFSYNIIEKPFLKLKNKFSTKKEVKLPNTKILVE